jgi:hypothetical protein
MNSTGVRFVAGARRCADPRGDAEAVAMGQCRHASACRSRRYDPNQVRRDASMADDRGIAFWVVSDNLRKGAATNAVELAEILYERDWIRPAAVRGASPYVGSGAVEATA